MAGTVLNLLLKQSCHFKTSKMSYNNKSPGPGCEFKRVPLDKLGVSAKF